MNCFSCGKNISEQSAKLKAVRNSPDPDCDVHHFRGVMKAMEVF